MSDLGMIDDCTAVLIWLELSLTYKTKAILTNLYEDDLHKSESPVIY
jgi:hypothetical protein